MVKRVNSICIALLLLLCGAAGAADWSLVVNDMRFMREEEKLARDVYATLYDYLSNQEVTLKIFDKIASSEQKHMNAMKKLLEKYGIPDSAVEGGQGIYPLSCRDAECLFNNTDLATLYTRLITDGKGDVLDAFLVGAYIEELDMTDLQEAIDNAAGYPDIQEVYENLLCGSANHLRAFARNIELTGTSYLDATEDYLADIRPTMDDPDYEAYMAALEAVLTDQMEICGKGDGKGPRGMGRGPKGPRGPGG